MVVAAARRLPHIDFHVVGAAASDLTWIEAPLPNNLQLHGYRPHGELGGYLRRFDIAVAPYGAEVQNASGVESAAITSPLKLLEYKAAGLPVIVSDLPGVRDILDGGETAMLVLPGDEQAFIAAVDRLASHPEERRRLGAAARQCFLDRHTVEARARRIVALAGEGSSAQ
jgi:glycosyltransferase involved in cell wall biosynthesis